MSVERVPGCSPIHSDVISDRKQAFSRIFGKRVTDGPTDGRTDRPSYRDAWTHIKSVLRHRGTRAVIHFGGASACARVSVCLCICVLFVIPRNRGTAISSMSAAALCMCVRGCGFLSFLLLLVIAARLSR